MVDPTDYLRLALDPVRLAVLGAAAVGPVDAGALSESLAIDARTVLRAIGKLRESGLLSDELTLDRAVLSEIGRTMPDIEAAASEVVSGPWSAEERDTLARFFRGSRLAEIPTTRSKRRIVLERLVQEFEPGVRYSERDVSRRLQLFHPDYAALRRYLVDDGLMTRADGAYWRSGGRFDPTV